jgi:hypothetical protein
MQQLERRLLIAALSVVTGILLLPALGRAATTFGSRLKDQPANSGECQKLGACTIISFIHPSEPNGDPYSGGAPVGGVITKFRIYAFTPAPTLVTFRVADISRPNPMNQTTATATVTGTGPTVTINPTEDPVIHEFGGRLPVKKGQHLAIDATDVQATHNDSGDKFSYIFTPQLLDGAPAATSNEPTGELLVQGDIEPDADNDGFGDETQDQCPSQATTQGQCDKTPPVVKGLKVRDGTISYRLSEASKVSFQLAKKLPGRRVGRKCVAPSAKNKGHKRCSRFKPIGARFKGSGKAGPNTVTLPNGKKLAPGTYRLTMTATDVAGNKTTETTTFKVKKRKKK